MTEYKLAEGKKIDFGINGWLDYCKEDDVEAERRGRDEMLAKLKSDAMDLVCLDGNGKEGCQTPYESMCSVCRVIYLADRVLELDGWKK